MAKSTSSGTFAVRASAAERAAWRRQAERLGMTRNDWIRVTLNGASGGAKPDVIAAARDERRLLLAAALPGRQWETDNLSH
jgi:hypothetical protein